MHSLKYEKSVPYNKQIKLMFIEIHVRTKNKSDEMRSVLNIFLVMYACNITTIEYLIKVITKLPNSEQSYKGKVKTHNYINRQNQSTTGKL
jgi:hypothetical protein